MRTSSRRAVTFLVCVHLGTSSAMLAEDEVSGFVAPAGFSVELVAGDDLAHDIYSMTLDTRGRPVVSGAGYIKTLVDRDGDGRADKAELFAAWPPGGAHGLLVSGRDLYASTGTGLYRLSDADGDGRADAAPTKIAAGYGGGEHSSNGIVKGPDGWLWWIHGNDARVNAEHITTNRSPVREVSCGAVVRLSPDGNRSEVYADGFRNPYDLDFGPFGQLYTYDADGERVHHLPWYSPTRVFDIAQGMHHGWVLRKWQHAWNQAKSNCDNVERLCEIGRGSPTGVVVYRHRLFPKRYRDGLFVACWSKGRVYHLPLTRRGSTFETELEVFLETSGDVGFAPVDLAVGPSGDLFVAIGGRGTRGSVFHVRYGSAATETAPFGSDLVAVLRAQQPLASWSRAQWVPVARVLGRKPFESAVIDESLPAKERIRAIEILVELFSGPSASVAEKLLSDREPEIVARTLWAAAYDDTASGREAVIRSTRSDDARILRAAWEGVARFGSPINLNTEPDWTRGLTHADRRVRAAAVIAARSPGGRDSFTRSISLASARDPKLLVGWLRGTAPPRGEATSSEEWFGAAERALREAKDRMTRLEATRMIVRGLGDIAVVQDQPRVTDGFEARDPGVLSAATRVRIARRLAAALPSGDRDLDRELLRTVAILAVDCPEALDKAAALWTPTSDVEDDIHFLLAAGRIRGEPPDGFPHAAASAFASLHRKMREDRRETSRFWPTRVAAAYRQLAGKVERLDFHLIADPQFGDAEHTLFLDAIGDDTTKAKAIAKLLDTARESGRWTSDLVRHVGRSGHAEALTALRERGRDPDLRDAVVLVLSKHSDVADRELFIEALSSYRSDVVRAAARALANMKLNLGRDELVDAFLALRRFCSHAREKNTREALRGLLAAGTGAEIEVRESADGANAHAAHAPWFDWLGENHPAEARAVSAVQGASIDEILARVSPDISAGDRERGALVFRSQGCYGCHRGARRLGPDLDGIGARFSTRDLLAAIVDPDRDISPAYVATEVVTTSGEVHRGLLVYSSPAATLMQTNADTTVRFSAENTVSLRKVSSSFMPKGLLSGLTDEEIADLLAYLRSLTKR